MDSTATAAKLETPADHVRVLHREARTGAVAVVHRPGGRWTERAIGLRELERYVDSLPDGLDCYGSQGRFAGRRRVASLITIDSVWLDIDYHRTTRYAASGPRDVLYALLGHGDAQGIPAPSYVLGTGRGLCAVWLHDVLPARGPRTLAGRPGGVTRSASRGFGVDGAARDAARVLRLVGSRNTKVDRPVRCLFPAVGEPERYAFHELAAVFLPYKSGREADRERARRPQLPLAGLRLAATAGRSTVGRALGAVGAAPRGFAGAARAALVRSAAARAPGPVADPCERWRSRWMVPAHLVRREVLHLAREALGGVWTREAVLRDMGSALRRAEAAAAGQLVEYPFGSGDLVDPRYRFRDQTIIDWLSISAEELAAMPASGQLGAHSLEVRQARRGRASGSKRREGLAERDREIAARRAEGASLRAIGADFGISAEAVRKALKRLKNPPVTAVSTEPCIGAKPAARPRR